MADIRKLQNGSDVRGIACAGIVGEDVNLTEDAGNLIGGGFVRWLADKKGKKTEELRIGIGHDSRITADSLFAQRQKESQQQVQKSMIVVWYRPLLCL